MKFEEVKVKIKSLGERHMKCTEDWEAGVIENEAWELIYDFLSQNSISIPNLNLSSFDKDDEDGEFIYDWIDAISEVYSLQDSDPKYKASLPRELPELFGWMNTCFGWE